jgi:hypothetical protein
MSHARVSLAYNANEAMTGLGGDETVRLLSGADAK